MTSCASSTNQPVWNDDCTLALDDEYEDILIEVFDKKKFATKTERYSLGQTTVSVKEAPNLQVMDVWLDIKSQPTPNPKYIVTGQLHVIYQKSRTSEDMMLNAFGSPLKDPPIRLNAGDLILCHSNALVTHTVHLSTRSQWDHVAMVIHRRERSQLLLFEATMDGVDAYLLNTAMKYYRSTGKVAIRRATCNRDEEFLEKLHSFVDEVTGRPYKQDWIQLVRAAYNANESDDLSSLFCSQLIAAAYQRVGILSSDVHSNNFLPSDFAGDFHGKLSGARMANVRKLHSVSKRKAIKLKEQYKDQTNVGPVSFVARDDPISNVRFTDTAMKRDAKLNYYAVYMIHVTTRGGWSWILFKRFSDFHELDKELRKYLNGVEALPRRFMVKADEQLIQKRRVALQHYMKRLLQFSDSKHCSLVSDFLTEGAKGVTLDPNRTIKKRKKSRTKKSPARSTSTINTTASNINPTSRDKPKKRPPKIARRSTTSSRSKSSTELEVPKPKRSPSWTKVTPDSSVAQPTHQFLRSSLGSPELSRRSKAPAVDISVMFASPTRPSILSSSPRRAPTRRPDHVLTKRKSVFFYQRKLKAECPSDEAQVVLETSDESEEEEDNEMEDELAKQIMAEENVKKLSDVANLDLDSLGIEDIDLEEFDIGGTPLEGDCDVGELMEELARSGELDEGPPLPLPRNI